MSPLTFFTHSWWLLLGLWCLFPEFKNGRFQHYISCQSQEKSKVGSRVSKGVDTSACSTETASIRIVCPVILTFCSSSPEHVAVVSLSLSNITAGNFMGISTEPVCLYTLFGHCKTFHAFKWLHMVFTLLLCTLRIFLWLFFFYYIFYGPFLVNSYRY